MQSFKKQKTKKEKIINIKENLAFLINMVLIFASIEFAIDGSETEGFIGALWVKWYYMLYFFIMTFGAALFKDKQKGFTKLNIVCGVFAAVIGLYLLGTFISVVCEEPIERTLKYPVSVSFKKAAPSAGRSLASGNRYWLETENGRYKISSETYDELKDVKISEMKIEVYDKECVLVDYEVTKEYE